MYHFSVTCYLADTLEEKKIFPFGSAAICPYNITLIVTL